MRTRGRRKRSAGEHSHRQSNVSTANCEKKPEKTHTRSAGKKTVAAVVGATDTMVAGQVDRSLSISVSCESSRGG